MPVPHASQALSRFTVLDLTRVRSGPTCERQLADWGANVIKIDALLEDAAGEQPGGPPPPCRPCRRVAISVGNASSRTVIRAQG
jgi:crotonobetainyl-CoA:carnitine CoA-transferase CaiB-like acyl-CoA transferase